ncbi:MAG: hypothetical protein QNJ05_01175 [Woeseiaceae bacterium]|nr:hypothetical protein [Woeseiaceae bacterium]
MGTLVTWGGLSALPAALVLAKPGWLNHAYAFCMRAALLLAVMWGLVSYLLADNWSFNFGANSEGFRGSSAAGRVFWFYSLLVLSAPLLIVVSAAVHRLLSIRERGRTD